MFNCFKRKYVLVLTACIILSLFFSGCGKKDVVKVASTSGEVTFTGWFMDKCCSAKGDPSKHTKTCAKMESCENSGYGILIKNPDNTFTFYPFDETGQALAKNYLQKTTKDADLRILVKGTLCDNVLKAASLKECIDN